MKGHEEHGFDYDEDDDNYTLLNDTVLSVMVGFNTKDHGNKRIDILRLVIIRRMNHLKRVFKTHPTSLLASEVKLTCRVAPSDCHTV